MNKALLLAGLLAAGTLQSQAQRQMERLNRGIVATRVNSKSAFISWRLLGLEDNKIGFNLYRYKEGDAAAVKLNSEPLTGGTNYTDATVDLSARNTYYVKTVENGVEGYASEPYTLEANLAYEPVIHVKLNAPNPLSNYATKYVWVGDLDGDGDYDFVLDKQAITAGDQQYVEAYKNDGTFLWRVCLGPNSTNTNNISPGASCIDVGHWDGVTVYDFDCDGKAEVALRTANGVTFGDGKKLSNSSDVETFVSMLNGETGAERARIKMPTDFSSAGSLAARFGVGYLDGKKPSLIGYLKNRNSDKSFNLAECAWSFDGSKITQQWKYIRDSNGGSDGHNTRIADVDGDGQDEVAENGFCLESDGKLKYVLPVVHGDRWYIGKMDKTRDGLQGYGIQQEAESGLLDYYYDAKTGKMLWTHSVDPANTYDVGRGDVGDLDPRYEGYEEFSFANNRTIYNAPSNKQTDTAQAPWPSIRIWWDGDLGSEQINETKFEKWKYESGQTWRLLTGYKFGASMGISNWHAFYGDILGDWREEVVFVTSSYDELLIFTTQDPTDTRIYTLPNNPCYRNCMTLKGYNQSHMCDFYLGYNMDTPPTPNISYIGDEPTYGKAELMKRGAGSSSQTIKQDSSIVDFAYEWKNAVTVAVTGLPEGITATVDNANKKVTFTGTTTAEPGTYTYTISTIGGTPDSVRTNKIVVASNSSESGVDNIENLMTTCEVVPNPINSNYAIVVDASEDGRMEWVLTNELGVVCQQGSESIATGRNIVRMERNGLASGIYILKMNVNGRNLYKKVIVSK